MSDENQIAIEMTEGPARTEEPKGMRIGLCLSFEGALKELDPRSFAYGFLLGLAEQRQFVSIDMTNDLGKSWVETVKGILRVRMPCGRLYGYDLMTFPLTTTPCDCGDPAHIVVAWDEPPEPAAGPSPAGA